MTKNVIFPREARDKHIVGTIYLSFTFSADSKVQDIKVLKRLGGGIEEATVRALKECTAPADAKTGITYVIPLSFNLVDPIGKPIPHLPGEQNVPTLQGNQVPLKAIIISAAIPPK